MKYYNRILDKVLDKRLKSKGAVLIEGPKWCGKTTTGKNKAKSVLEIDKPNLSEQYIKLSSIAPETLLEGKTPRLIDEWQLAPKLWNAVRYEVDNRNEMGQFILTGSTVPIEFDKTMHTGIGRISKIYMRTMSLFESKDSDGKVSLEEIFLGGKINSLGNIDLDKICYLICRGGWPRSIDLPKEEALFQAIDYFDVLVQSDVSRIDGVKRDTNKISRLLKSYARHVASQSSIETIRNDILPNVDSFDPTTIYSYIEILKKLFVIEDMSSWNPNLLSKTVIRTTDTRFFVDPSIAAAALGVSSKDLITDLKTLGKLFENLCIRDLRIYSQALDGQVYHYRDKNGLECDAIIHLRTGEFGLVEIKLGGDESIENGAKTLKTLASKLVDKPKFMMILCAITPYNYIREDGIYVVSITSLKN